MPYTNPEMLSRYPLVSFKTQIFFPLFHGLACNAKLRNIHRRSGEPFWRKVPSRMTGNSGNFTDANRRVSQPGLDSLAAVPIARR